MLKKQDKLISENALDSNWQQKIKKLFFNSNSSKSMQEKNTELGKYKFVLDQAPGSVILMNRLMNFEFINPCFTQVSGYTKEDLFHENINYILCPNVFKRRNYKRKGNIN